MAEPIAGRSGPGFGLRRAELWVLGAAVVSVGGFVLAALWAGGLEVLVHLGRLSGALLLGLLLLSLLNYGLRLIRWQLFSRRLGLDVAWPRAALYYVAGFALTVTPGKLGEALRLWLLRRGHGYRYERTAALLVGDRLSDAAATALLCLAGLSAVAGHVGLALALAALVGSATALAFRPGPLLTGLAWTYGRVGRWPRLFARVRTALRQTARLGAWSVFGPTLVLALLGWLAECVALWWLLAVFGAPLAFGQAVFVFALAMLAGGLLMLPGGLGGVEVGMVGLLAALGIELDVAVSATAVVRATTLWFAVGLGFLALPLALRAVGAAPAVQERART
jgi:uncharacterized membrane protein YbhN (UPF0104 family)